MLYSIFLVLGVLLLSAVGFWLGLRISRLKRFWFVGFVIPFVFFATIIIIRKLPELRFVVPFSFLTDGRNEFVILAVSVTIMIGTLLPRLRTKGQKITLSILTPFAVFYFVIPPFLGSIFIQNDLKNIKTSLQNGVCAQSTAFTCGPASAVTALKQFGIEAQEGQIAIEAYTNPVTGTPNNLLVQAIEKLFHDHGISCNYRRFDSVKQLEDMCPVIVNTKFATYIDHYVTVIDVSDDHVIIGDPLKGRTKLSYKEFEDIWRFVGIVVTQNPSTRGSDQPDHG